MGGDLDQDICFWQVKRCVTNLFGRGNVANFTHVIYETSFVDLLFFTQRNLSAWWGTYWKYLVTLLVKKQLKGKNTIITTLYNICIYLITWLGCFLLLPWKWFYCDWMTTVHILHTNKLEFYLGDENSVYLGVVFEVLKNLHTLSLGGRTVDVRPWKKNWGSRITTPITKKSG